MKKKFAILVVYFLSALVAWPAPSAATTTVDTITRLSRSEASQQLPVSFDAVVTYFRSYDHMLFVQDGPSAMYVNATTDLKLVPGDRVRVRGTTHDSFRNYVESKDIALLGHDALPVPIEASYEQMIHGAVDCRLARVRAIVRSAEIVPSSVLLVPATALRMLIDGEQVDAEVGGSDATALPNLLDAEVEVTGVVSGHFDNKMQQTGVLFHVRSLDDIQILRRPTIQPWSIPVTSMDRVITGYSIVDRTQRTRCMGSSRTICQGRTGAAGRQPEFVDHDRQFSAVAGGRSGGCDRIPGCEGRIPLSYAQRSPGQLHSSTGGCSALYVAHARRGRQQQSWASLRSGFDRRGGCGRGSAGDTGRICLVERRSPDVGDLSSSRVAHARCASAMREVPVGSRVRVTGICMLADATHS